ncbi:YncE family protein, partial [Streptomyces sp. NPDC127084]|uniref:YncE family protein n=1 Tax=Streptomyces sp. NPDC127084 TaxID=3347133 RepID=UPI00365805F7
DGARVFVTNFGSDSVSVIDTASNTVTATIPVSDAPVGVGVSPDGARVFVTNFGSDSVSVIDTASNTVTATIPVGNAPYGVAVGVFVAIPASSEAECPNGSVITGGGHEINGPLPSNFTSKPVGDAWQVSLVNESDEPITFTPYAVCVPETTT